MRRTLPTPKSVAAPLALLTAAGLMLGGCSGSSPDKDSPSGSETAATAAEDSGAPADPNPPQDPATLPDQGLPFDALPVTPEGKAGWVDCPYLDTQWVSDTNGQRMTGLGIDQRFDTPACVFWSYPEEPQLTVIVRHMPTAKDATAVVDWAAPIDTTEPAEEPEGWSGGRVGGGVAGHQTALYAVAKDKVAVVVFTNQEQSFKAEKVAKEVIHNLGL